MSKCALIMAGGTGGHIFPGLAVAQALRERGAAECQRHCGCERSICEVFHEVPPVW